MSTMSRKATPESLMQEPGPIPLCDRALELLNDPQQYRLLIGSFLRRCESPVEQILAVQLYLGMNAWVVGYGGKPTLAGRLMPEPAGSDGLLMIVVQAQAEIDCVGCTYRADFLVTITRFWERGPRLPALARLAIEVDGHDFHERTKEQASRDRERDRHLLRQGIPVMRFTGSDVYRRPQQAWRDIAEQVGQLTQSVYDLYASAARLAELVKGDADYRGAVFWDLARESPAVAPGYDRTTTSRLDGDRNAG